LQENNNEKHGSAIFVDEPELKYVTPDFTRYANAISNIILNSSPRFTVGIFGEWGTGKTTLMLNMKKILEDRNCNCLLFNAWRYEREKTYSTIPLMLSMIESLLQNRKVHTDLMKDSDNRIEKIIRKAGRVIRGLSFYAEAGIPSLAQVGFNYDASKVNEAEDTPPASFLETYKEKKPLLQEGVELIEDLLDIAEGPTENKYLKLIVFIDDLDRCTPEKAAEVFESIKIFFDMKGLVFVLGLSKRIVEAAIDSKYKGFTGGIFTGSDYLKKIIQISFSLPAWSEEDLELYINSLLENRTNDENKNFFKENTHLIVIAVESNPREVKRLLNNFILASEILGESDTVDKKELLAVQSLLNRWKWFYDEIVHDRNKLKILEDHWFTKKGKIAQAAVSMITDKAQSRVIPPIIDQVEKDASLTRFLKDEKAGRIIFGITKERWSVYRRALQVEPALDELDADMEKLKREKDMLEKRIVTKEQMLNEAMSKRDHLQEKLELANEGREFYIDGSIEIVRNELKEEEDTIKHIKEDLVDLKKDLLNKEQSIRFKEWRLRE